MSEECFNILEERKRRNMEELVHMEEQYLDAHTKKLSIKTTVTREVVKKNNFAKSGSQRDVLRCFACDGRGHRAVNCPSRASTSRNELKSRFRRSYCYKCGSTTLRIAGIRRREIYKVT